MGRRTGEYDYHRQPAPWIQMHLLRILALLGRADQSASEGMYEVQPTCLHLHLHKCVSCAVHRQNYTTLMRRSNARMVFEITWTRVNFQVLVDVMRRGDTGINIGYAIVYECVRTVTTIYPNVALLDAAATSISRFIRRCTEVRSK
jgi:AP-4 complex subunit epsilon-1